MGRCVVTAEKAKSLFLIENPGESLVKYGQWDGSVGHGVDNAAAGVWAPESRDSRDVDSSGLITGNFLSSSVCAGAAGWIQTPIVSAIDAFRIHATEVCLCWIFVVIPL
jgi:hypothetical protein